MRKIISIFTMLFLMLLTVSAQEKKNVCIDEFDANSSIESNWVKALRSSVTESLMATGRLNIIDISTFSGLSSTNEERLVQLKERNVDVLLKGHFTSLECALDKDKKYYVTKGTYTLSLINTETGAIINTTSLDLSWYSGETNDESITKAIGNISSDIKKFVDDNFKMNATIKALDQVDAKKGAKTVYVTVGSAAGIQVGQMFDVFQEVEVAGETITKLIGTAKAKEVVSANMTLCTVTKGGVEIKNAFDNNFPLSVVSRAKKTLWNTLDKATNIL